MQDSTRQIVFGFVVALGVFCLASFVAARPILDEDFWWHLATGRYIAETGALPDQDPFSFTTPYIDNINDEARTSMLLKGYWLAQLSIFHLYESFSFAGIVVYKGLVYASIVLLMYMLMRRGGMRAASSALILTPFFFPQLMRYLHLWSGERPGHLSFVLALLMVYLLEGIREPTLRGERPHWARLIAPLPVMAIWANLHGGYILGVALICIYMVELILVPLIRRSRPDRVRMLALCAGIAAIAASALNPNGYKAFEVVFDMARAGGPPVQVFEEMSPIAVWRMGIPGTGFHLYYLMAVILMGLPVLRRMGLSQSLVLAFLVTISLLALRYVEALVFIGYPLVATAWAGLIKERAGRFIPPRSAVVVALVIMALTAGYVGAQRHLKTDFYVTSAFPHKSARFISRLKPEGNLFNYYDWGGYLIWTLYPDYKVFIDGRMLSYKAAEKAIEMIGKPYPRAWERASRFYGINTAILPAYSMAGVPVELFMGILNSDDWAPVFTDNVATVFLRKSPANARIIDSMGMDREEILEWVRRQKPDGR